VIRLEFELCKPFLERTCRPKLKLAFDCFEKCDQLTRQALDCHDERLGERALLVTKTVMKTF
jgi:hypothetical protein